MRKLNRREFIGAVIGGTGAVTAGALLWDGQTTNSQHRNGDFTIDSTIKSPIDQVSLGKSGIKVSLVGIGTGSGGWARASNQTRLGQAEFTKQMRHAFDNGINFFDLADQYGSHPFFTKAMTGVGRDKYVIQTKSTSRRAKEARADIDRFLKELNTDYIDSLIIHNVTEADWTTRFQEVMEVFAEAKKAGKIRSHGVTCHSFVALEAAAASDWVQINMVRWNSRQSHMDADVKTAGSLFEKMRRKGQGMIGMKVVGQGSLVEGNDALTPDECFKFQIESGVVDAFVVGVQKIEHIDRLLKGTRTALNQVGYRTVKLAENRRT
ncbi:MAG: Ferredoxin [uncultured Pyrinomonadaceae bacterium]|uniref:Ferredoxin n=1 Tax=uncultured Pyrinomonadaceae bacterium TaxID=2283094 RepID=A0A6J4NCM2_9BACT|nr:MAG: Ferredoxin [uncultured Pyrinomonadaceae bacterium]